MAAPASNPRIRVAAVLPVEGGIVVVRHIGGGIAYHLLPGGGVEQGETIETALVREITEETGLRCEIVAPLFISDSIDPDSPRHMVQLTFLCRVIGGELTDKPLDQAVVGVEVVDPINLPSLDFRPPMAQAVYEASLHSFDVPARYLGALWTRGHGSSSSRIPSVAD